jgi:hypothetical protein
MQVSLSKLQHILISVGVSVPATQRDGRHAELLTYFPLGLVRRRPVPVLALSG